MEPAYISACYQAIDIVGEVGGQVRILDSRSCPSTILASLLVPFADTNVLGDRLTMGITLEVGLHLSLGIGPYLRRRYRVRSLEDAVPRGVPAIPHRYIRGGARALNNSIWLIGDLNTIYLVISEEVTVSLEFFGLVDAHRRGCYHRQATIP